MRSHDVEDLWHRFGTGDGSAFAQLYRDHQLDVVRYCWSLLHDEQDAHDAAQGTWAALWTTPHAARRDIPLRPWLFRIAHNEAIDILRRRRAHETLADLDVAALDDVASTVEVRERLATLRADLLSLPERQRAALLLREVAGLGHAEIGAVFGISAAAAKQTIYEARCGLTDAEGGRTMACGLVQRALSDGDGRVRRGRRLRAHLRGCAACRAFADSVARRRRELHLLFPAPGIVAAVARATAGAGAGGGVVGGSALVAGGSVATKVAVAAAVLVVAGVGGRHEIAHAGHAHARAGTAETPVAATFAVARRPATAGARTVTAAPQPVSRAKRSAGPEPRVASRRRTKAAPASLGVAAPAVAQQPTADSHGGAGAEARAVAPPGQARKTQSAAASAPGQAKKTEKTQSAAASAPGQAKKTEKTQSAAASPPGQAKKTEKTQSAAASPPGQAKKTETAAASPPGQAKKADGAEPAAPAATATPTPPPSNADAPPGHADTPPGHADTPPGQAKK